MDTRVLLDETNLAHNSPNQTPFTQVGARGNIQNVKEHPNQYSLRTHQHSAPRRAAPSSEKSALETGKQREKWQNNEANTLGIKTILGCLTSHIILTVTRSYSLNFYSHFRSAVSFFWTTLQCERKLETWAASWRASGHGWRKNPPMKQYYNNFIRIFNSETRPK